MDKLTLKPASYNTTFPSKKEKLTWRDIFFHIIHLATIFFFFYQNGFGNIWFVTKLVVFVIVVASVSRYFHKAWMKKTKIELTDTGIEYVSGLPRIANIFYPSWNIKWSDIDYVTFMRKEHSKGLLVGTLRIKTTSSVAHKISSDYWFNPDVEESPITFKESFFNSGEIIDKKIKSSRLFETIEGKGFAVEVTKNPHKTLKLTDFDKSPIAFVLAGLFIFSMIYFAVEFGFTLTEDYASKPSYLWFVLIGILSAFVAYYCLKNAKLNILETSFMSVCVGAGIALMSFPGVLRVNQLTDKDGLQTYSYTLVEKGRWMSESLNQQIPDLYFHLSYSDYWDKFEINTSKEFELRKGGLGFYQVNMDPIRAEQHKYHLMEKEAVKTAMQNK